MNKAVLINVPGNFSFKATVYSHGWCDLAPFKIDEQNWRLTYVFHDPNGDRAAPATICEMDATLVVELDDAAAVDKSRVEKDIRHVLRLDEDLSGFYSSVAGQDGLEWVERRLAGRLLRSPTVFEDLVKTICTTNCSWNLTKNMASNLVSKLGQPALDGSFAFPTANAMAAQTDDFYRDEIRAGYRSPYFVELAEAVASGKVDPESWLRSELPTAELKQEIKMIKGVGDYAAENLLKLLGRYDGLALDSWLRSQFYKKHNREKVCPDKKIERHYRKYGQWRGLAIWCDMTEKWIA
jgi:N-glycosylase/DNA lyase